MTIIPEKSQLTLNDDISCARSANISNPAQIEPNQIITCTEQAWLEARQVFKQNLVCAEHSRAEKNKDLNVTEKPNNVPRIEESAKLINDLASDTRLR